MDKEKTQIQVTVIGEPELKTITPNSGANAGKETKVLSFRAYKPNFTKNEDGSFTRGNSTFYSVKVYGENAERALAFVVDGLRLLVDGFAFTRTYEVNNEERTENVINVDLIAIPINQVGLKRVEFEKRQKDDKQ